MKIVPIVMMVLVAGSTIVAAIRNYRVNKFYKEQMKKREKEEPHSKKE